MRSELTAVWGKMCWGPLGRKYREGEGKKALQMCTVTWCHTACGTVWCVRWRHTACGTVWCARHQYVLLQNVLPEQIKMVIKKIHGMVSFVVTLNCWHQQ